jgi:hypothetical protein
MASLVAALLSWVHAVAGYPIPATAPMVQFASHQFLVDTMCGGVDCPVAGMYLYGNTVYLDDRLDVEDNPFHQSILLHELVHYLQKHSGLFAPPSCTTWVAAEREAYRLQARWLAERQLAYPVMRYMPRADLCESQVQAPDERAPGVGAGDAVNPVPRGSGYAGLVGSGRRP